MGDTLRRIDAWIDESLAPTVRAFAKWYFDLIKNTLVVVALMYAWKRTGDQIIGAVASLTLGVFIMYLFSYPWSVHTVIQAYGRSHPPLLSLLVRMLGVLILGGLVVVVGLAGMEAIAALFSAQGPIK